MHNRTLTVNIDLLKPTYALANGNTENNVYVFESLIPTNSANNRTDNRTEHNKKTEENYFKIRSGTNVWVPDRMQMGFCLNLRFQ